MKRKLALILGVAMGLGSSAWAEEPPHLEFVRGLRARQLPELALEYLEQLQKSGQELPPEVAAVIPVEVARARLDVALVQADGEQREALLAKAAADFEDFLKDNPKPELALHVSLELAQIATMRGKALLIHAGQTADAKNQQADREKARAQFEETEQRLLQAKTLVGALMQKQKNPQTELDKSARQSLQQIKLQAELDGGISLFHQAQTHGDKLDDLVKRGELANKAVAQLRVLAAQDTTNPICWQARAWLGRCYMDVDTPKQALTQLAQVINDPGAASESGKRLARYFRLLIMYRDPTVRGDVNVEIQKAAEVWLDTYSAFADTPEGQGVRFQLAEAYIKQVMRMPEAQRGSERALKLLDNARRLYDSLEQSSEYAGPARERKISILVTIAGKRSVVDVNTLDTFDECYVQAQVVMAQMGKDEQALPRDASDALLKKFTERRKQYYKTIIAALSRGLDLADNKPSSPDQNEARFILAYAYLSTNEPYQAVIVGEDLARRAPRSARAATAAGYALQAYSQIVAEEERNGTDKAVIEVDRARLRRLALFMEQTWPSDPATDLARHQLGTIALREKDYLEAIKVLKRIRPTYGGFTFSQYELTSALLQADKEKLNPEKGQASFQDQALDALKKIPELTPGADPATTQVYLYAKLELAKILFAAKQYKEMEALSEHLRDCFRQAKLDEGTRKDLQPALASLPFYARFGQADAAFRAGQYQEVRRLLDPVVQEMQAKKVDLKDLRLVREILGMDLRANVQEGNSAHARKVLDMLLASAGELEGGPTAILMELVQQMRSQVERLKEGGAKTKTELDQTIERLSAFLDDFAKQAPKTLTPQVIRFLALGYASVEKHDRAVEFLERIPKPVPSSDPDKEKRERDDAENEAYHRAILLMRVREMRLAGKLEAADKELKKLQEEEWGKRSLEIQKEQGFLLEDQEKYPAAAKVWNEIMSRLRPKIGQDNKIDEQYYEGYYHITWCVCKNALRMKDEQKKQENIRRAAGYITKLESAKPDMGSALLKKKYEELLRAEPTLKREYDELKKN